MSDPAPESFAARRAREKEDLTYRLGALFGPLEDVARASERFDAQQTARVVARYCAEYPRLIQAMNAFCDGEEGHRYAVEAGRVRWFLIDVESQLMHTPGATLATVLPERVAGARAALAAVPIPSATTVFPAGSPFSAYAALRDLCGGDVASELAWVDPYHGPSVFYRYLRVVPATAAVALAAAEPAPSAGAKDRARWDAFLDASRLFARERGPARYRLVVHPAGALHDRWLRLDGRRVYGLGGSAKDAAARQDFALSPATADAAVLARVEQAFAGGRELFGPSTPAHA